MRLLSWIGTADYAAWQNDRRDGPGPLLGVALRVKPRYAEILWDDGSKKVPIAEADAYSLWLKKQLASNGIECQINVHKCANAQVVDFGWVYSQLQGLADLLDLAHGEVSINASSGTWVMSACWIVFKKATGLDFRLFQSSKEKGVEAIALPPNLQIDMAEVLQGRRSPLFDRYARGDIRINLRGFQDLISESEPMKETLLEAILVAKFKDVPVLLLGPPGVGKSRLARLIHEKSGLSTKAWVTVDCGMLMDERSIYELWGWEKGAFTSADRAYPGRICEAQGGTVFFDEIGNAPALTQQNLLRLLQEKRYRPAGSSEEKKADVRIIAATNKDLRKELGTGFRQDLFDRLSTYVIQIPPLREHREDIIPLARTLLRDFNQTSKTEILETGGSLKKLSKEAERELQRYDWPGNFRELENVIIRLAIRTVGREEEISVDDVRRELATWCIPSTDQLAHEPLGEGFELERVLNRVRLHYLIEARRASGGNKSKMAQLLGFKNRTPLRTLVGNLQKEGFDTGEG
jgi:DNA-binding NtrC family response regulator